MKFPQPKNNFMNEITPSSSVQKESDHHFFGAAEKSKPFFNSNSANTQLTGASDNAQGHHSDTMNTEAIGPSPSETHSSTVIRKCAACEKEDKKIQKKTDVNSFGAQGRIMTQGASGKQAVTPPGQAKENTAGKKELPDLDTMYFAKKGMFPVAIPGSYTSVQALALYLFRDANTVSDDTAEPTSVADLIIKSLKDMNGLPTDDVYPLQHILLGDLPMHYGFTEKALYYLKNTPQFGENVTDPVNELARMGVGSLDEFIAKKQQLDREVKIDIIKIITGINRATSGDFFNQKDNEEYVLKLIRRWVREPLATRPEHYPEGGEYFDTIITALSSNVFVLNNILVDEWTSSYDLMFNRFVYYKGELETLQKIYSYSFKNEKPIREMSLWQDFAKPAIIRIPAAITEETACFIKSLPSDLAKNVGEGLHGISSDYLDAVLPEEGETNRQTQEIACTFGGIVFDLAGELANVKKIIDAIKSAEELFKTYKEITILIENLPDALSIFEDSDKFFDVLLALSSSTALDRLETFVMTEQASQPQNPQQAAEKSGLEKFRQIVTDFVSLIKKVLRPVFEIRRKFMEFVARAEDTLVSHPMFMKLIEALMEGKKLAGAPGDLSEKFVQAIVSLLVGLKEEAGEFIKSIGDQAMGALDGFKTRISEAIADFAITEIKNVGGTVKAALSIPPVRTRVDKLIASELVNPFLDKAGFEKITGKVHSIVDMLVQQAMKGVNFVIDTLGDVIRSGIENMDLQLHAKKDEGLNLIPQADRIALWIEHSTGEDLSVQFRRQMEIAFGFDFSSVRIHHDALAAQAAEHLSAEAFTMGNHIFFNTGKYDIGSIAGRQLLAHELTHVVQQSGGETPASIQKSLTNKPKKLMATIVANSHKLHQKLTQKPPKKLSYPSGDAKADYSAILSGALMDLSDFINPDGTKLNINRNRKDAKGRTNIERMANGLSPLLDDKTKVELHHVEQNFFNTLNEMSASYHRSVDDDPDYHPYFGDAGYLSWRGEVGWYKGKIVTLGFIYNKIRGRYWRKRAKQF